MKIKHGPGKTKYGPGVSISMSCDEVGLAIDAWLVAHGVAVDGPRTIRINKQLVVGAEVYVDPSGDVYVNGGVIRGNGTREGV